MDKNGLLRELAGLARRSPSVALWALGYLATGQELEVLQECVEGAREMAELDRPRRADHLEAYRERWGRLPDED